MSAAVTGPSPFFLSDRIASARLCRRNTTPLRLRRMSTTSSRTPSSVEYSCTTPAICTALERLHGHAGVVRREVLDVDNTRLEESRLGHVRPVCLLRVQLDDEAFVD